MKFLTFFLLIFSVVSGAEESSGSRTSSDLNKGSKKSTFKQNSGSSQNTVFGVKGAGEYKGPAPGSISGKKPGFIAAPKDVKVQGISGKDKAGIFTGPAPGEVKLKFDNTDPTKSKGPKPGDAPKIKDVKF